MLRYSEAPLVDCATDERSFEVPQHAKTPVSVLLLWILDLFPISCFGFRIYFLKSLSPISVNPFLMSSWAASVGSSTYSANAGPRGRTSSG